jgi:DNA-directed RNA polymerase specialized sigma24 family protein
LQAKRQQKAEEDLTAVKEMTQGAHRILQRAFIGKLPPDQGTVMWGVFSLKSEEQIAREMGVSVKAVRRLRSQAERKLGGGLNF